MVGWGWNQDCKVVIHLATCPVCLGPIPGGIPWCPVRGPWAIVPGQWGKAQQWELGRTTTTGAAVKWSLADVLLQPHGTPEGGGTGCKHYSPGCSLHLGQMGLGDLQQPGQKV